MAKNLPSLEESGRLAREQATLKALQEISQTLAKIERHLALIAKGRDGQ